MHAFAKEEAVRYIDMFKVDANPFFFEEEYRWKKVGAKREHSETMGEEDKKELGRPMGYKFQKIVGGGDNGPENSV